MHATNVSSFKSGSSPLVGLLSAAKFIVQGRQESKAIGQVYEGFHMMVNGLSMVLQSTEVILNDKIDYIMDHEASVISDDMFEDFHEFENVISALQPLIFEDGVGLPDDFRRSVARVIERCRILQTLERQFREHTSVPAHISMSALQGENPQTTKKFVGGWTEA
ncbi:hypothetical protein [Vibrio bivalvicida]|uniref:Uncharacterized protein n=1 Tax=Vibrio bivalvicida TaxID=1276888 RepID=A0A177XW30_9VIBR|nr:hypothetical protein [Vibrio bivalvicida]OAJ92813.1 hypothetical protein APB76_18055 [Vibrio bivalvicida]